VARDTRIGVPLCRAGTTPLHAVLHVACIANGQCTPAPEPSSCGWSGSLFTSCGRTDGVQAEY